MSIILSHNAGIFSCSSVRLHFIVKYFNIHKVLPYHVDTSNMFHLYKTKNADITFELFEHYDNCNSFEYNGYIDYDENHQFKDYHELDYNTCFFVKKYFTPSSEVRYYISEIETKYKINYDNICVLFYRGNNKKDEILLCNYDEYKIYADKILSNNPNIQFLIQSDETEFIERFVREYPNSFYFKDEIRHIPKCDESVDICIRNNIDVFAKKYLAITIIMSKCKYIICNTGNCSIWIMLYRGNNHNVYQNNNRDHYKGWIEPKIIT
jgi:hypothetical protein